MSKVVFAQCGGDHKEARMDIETNDFVIEIGSKHFRFEIDSKGDISILLINGVDVKVITERSYAGIKLISR